MIDWRLIVLIACMMSFGVAMEKTGADQYLADLIVQGTGQYGPIAVLAGFFHHDGCAYAADVKPGRRSGHAADRSEDCTRPGIKPKNVCGRGDLCGLVFFSDTS